MPQSDIQANFTLKIISLLKDILDLLDKRIETRSDSFRGLNIEMSYHKKVLLGMRPKDAREETAKEYFICEKAVQKIIYNKKNNCYTETLSIKKRDCSN